MIIPAGKLTYYLAYPFLRIFSSTLAKRRVRIAVYSPTGRVLLVKSWFGRQRWSLPGGGIERGETPEEAAVRELSEETSIVTDASKLKLLGEIKGTDGLAFHLMVFELHIDNETLLPLQKGRSLEIIERKWFHPDALPEDTSPAVRWSTEQ